MNKDKDLKSKLCPFKRIVEREFNGHTGKGTFNERFAPCAGERCMAYYRVGAREMCRRLQPPEGKP